MLSFCLYRHIAKLYIYLFMKQIPKSKINICNLTTSAYLGVSMQEKAVKQEVKWEVEIQFLELVKGCFDDNIDSTVCYDKIANKKLINKQQQTRTCIINYLLIIFKLYIDAYI